MRPLHADALWTAALYVLAARVAGGIRELRLVLPPVVRAGASTTLLCLFDMEGEPLYAVKWYRGTREFYRYEPGNRPPAQVIPFPGISVDLSLSNAHQVALKSVPPHLSGPFSCEVSADAPSFSTATVTDNLTVMDFPDIRIDSDLFDEGDVLTVNCTYEPPKWRSPLTFYVNNRPAPREHVREWPGGASLRLVPRAADVLEGGELRMRCVLLLAGQFPVSSDSVAVWLPLPRTTPPPIGYDAPAAANKIGESCVWLATGWILSRTLV